MQCRCPGPHEDTIKAGPCSCAVPLAPGPTPEDLERERCANSGHALSNGTLGTTCVPCMEYTNRELRQELNDAEVVHIALKARKQGLENRVKYLESLLRECGNAAAKAGIMPMEGESR